MSSNIVGRYMQSYQMHIVYALHTLLSFRFGHSMQWTPVQSTWLWRLWRQLNMHLRLCCISFLKFPSFPAFSVRKALGPDTSNRMYSDVQCIFFPAPNEANQDGKSASITAPNGPSQEPCWCVYKLKSIRFHLWSRHSLVQGGWNIHCDIVYVLYIYIYQSDSYSDIVTCQCIYYVDYVEICRACEWSILLCYIIQYTRQTLPADST